MCLSLHCRHTDSNNINLIFFFEWNNILNKHSALCVARKNIKDFDIWSKIQRQQQISRYSIESMRNIMNAMEWVEVFLKFDVHYWHFRWLFRHIETTKRNSKVFHDMIHKASAQKHKSSLQIFRLCAHMPIMAFVALKEDEHLFYVWQTESNMMNRLMVPLSTTLIPSQWLALHHLI